MNNALSIVSTSSNEARVSGRIDVENAKLALARGASLFVGKSIATDVSGLQSADSVTLAVLLAWMERTQNSGGVLTFKGVSTRLRAIAHLSDVESLLGFDVSAEAIRSD